jgi:hypothetical protein
MGDNGWGVTLNTFIDLLLQKGFTAVAGGVGLKLILVDAVLGVNQRVEIMAIGALLLSVSAVTSSLNWKTRLSVVIEETKKIDVDKKRLEDDRKSWSEILKKLVQQQP